MYVLPGCKSLGCPTGKFVAVGTTWEASKLRGLNIMKYLQPRNRSPWEVVYMEQKLEADPLFTWGRPMTRRKKQANALRGTAGAGDEASEERFVEITSGRSRWQQGLVATCKDF
jgi:hypothetical protein